MTRESTASTVYIYTVLYYTNVCILVVQVYSIGYSNIWDFGHCNQSMCMDSRRVYSTMEIMDDIPTTADRSAMHGVGASLQTHVWPFAKSIAG